MKEIWKLSRNVLKQDKNGSDTNSDIENYLFYITQPNSYIIEVKNGNFIKIIRGIHLNLSGDIER